MLYYLQDAKIVPMWLLKYLELRKILEEPEFTASVEIFNWYSKQLKVGKYPVFFCSFNVVMTCLK
jgi:hypothetical protein